MSKITLKEIIEYQKGAVFKSQDYQKQGVGIVRVSDFEGDSISLDNIYYISNEIADKNKKVRLKPYDVVITTVGATAGNFIRIPVEADGYLLNQNTVRLRTKENNKWDQIYLFYALKYKNFQEFLLLGAQGSAQPSIVLDQILDAEIAYPDNRREIAKKLFSMDQKIHLNTQINQTLEQIAQALFKSWFVDFDPVRAKVQALSDGLSLEQAELAAMQAISRKTPEELTALSQTQPDRYAELAETAKAFPCEMVEVDGVEVPKGWKQITLSEICEMQNGYAFKSSEWTDSGIPVIKIGSIQSKILTVEGNGFVSEDNLSLRSNFVLNDGDIAIGLTGAYVGKVGRMPANKKAMLNQRVAKFLAKRINESETFYSFIYMNVIQEEFKNFIDFTAQGSAQPNISTKDILKYPLLLANNEVHLAFEKLLKKILDKSIFNSYQNEILSNSRDLLLPRLLDGENYE